jgi:hypothetical protein
VEEKKQKWGEIKAQVTQISRTLLAPAAVRSSWQHQPPPVEAPKGTFPSPAPPKSTPLSFISVESQVSPSQIL